MVGTNLNLMVTLEVFRPLRHPGRVLRIMRHHRRDWAAQPFIVRLMAAWYIASAEVH